MKFKILLLLLSMYGVISAKDDSKSDSLKSLIMHTHDDQVKFNALRELSSRYLRTSPETAKEYINQAWALAKQMGDSANIAVADYYRGDFLFIMEEPDSALTILLPTASALKEFNRLSDLAYCQYAIAGIYLESGRYPLSAEWFNKCLETARKENNKDLICESLMGLGSLSNQIGERVKGIEQLQQALKKAEENKNQKLIAQILLYIGSAYSETKNEDYALSYFKRASEIGLSEKDTTLIIQADMFIGNSNYYEKKYDKAIKVYEQVMRLSEERDPKVYAGSIGNIGNVYADMGDNKKALEYQFKAIDLFRELKDLQGLTICYSAIGSSYFHLQHYSEAIKFYNEALSIAEENNSYEDLIEIHEGLSKTYEALKEYRSAYTHFKLYKQFNDSIYNQTNTKKITELELNYRFSSQQKEQELIEHSKETLANEKLKRQQLLTYASIAGIILLLLLVLFFVRNNSQRKKANITLQKFNDEVTHQKEVIEHKSKEISDSINYAKRIQESILPVKKEIQNSFREAFVLFKPRDVVSGDFYWFARREDKSIIACVDCTGHGVPGAFMSMIGNTLLNEIVNEKGIERPSEILNLLHLRIRQSLKQDMVNTETKDGMDIALCTIDLKRGLLEYAGANRSLYIIRNKKLQEIKPTKSPIGGEKLEDRTFVNNEINILSEDRIYMTTDGYADQFGGAKGKKFMVKQFQQLLLEVHEMSMQQQEQKLMETILTWQGNNEQVDDILLIGIKI